MARKIFEGEGRILVVSASACKAGKGRKGEPYKPSHVASTAVRKQDPEFELYEPHPTSANTAIKNRRL